MGIAAYNRGTKLISRQITESLPAPLTHDLVVLQDINQLPKGTVSIFQDTVARMNPNGTGWILMNNQEEGWSSFGYEFRTLREIVKTFAVNFTGIGQDEFSRFVKVGAS